MVSCPFTKPKTIFWMSLALVGDGFLSITADELISSTMTTGNKY